MPLPIANSFRDDPERRGGQRGQTAHPADDPRPEEGDERRREKTSATMVEGVAVPESVSS